MEVKVSYQEVARVVRKQSAYYDQNRPQKEPVQVHCVGEGEQTGPENCTHQREQRTADSACYEESSAGRPFFLWLVILGSAEPT